jgi:hypothetical protein
MSDLLSDIANIATIIGLGLGLVGLACSNKVKKEIRIIVLSLSAISFCFGCSTLTLFRIGPFVLNNLRADSLFVGSPDYAKSSEPICKGEGAFRDLETTNPVFVRPDGYSYGWITTDSASIVLPSGTTELIPHKFVLIVEDMDEVALTDVETLGGEAKIHGCWFRNIPLEVFYAEADEQYEKMVEGDRSLPVGMYRIRAGVLERIDQ